MLNQGNNQLNHADIEEEIESTQQGGLIEREEPPAPPQEPADTEDE